MYGFISHIGIRPKWTLVLLRLVSFFLFWPPIFFFCVFPPNAYLSTANTHIAIVPLLSCVFHLPSGFLIKSFCSLPHPKSSSCRIVKPSWHSQVIFSPHDEFAVSAQFLFWGLVCQKGPESSVSHFFCSPTSWLRPEGSSWVLRVFQPYITILYKGISAVADRGQVTFLLYFNRPNGKHLNALSYLLHPYEMESVDAGFRVSVGEISGMSIHFQVFVPPLNVVLKVPKAFIIINGFSNDLNSISLCTAWYSFVTNMHNIYFALSVTTGEKSHCLIQIYSTSGLLFP